MTSTVTSPHPATTLFAAQLRRLMSECQIRRLDTQKVRQLTPLGLFSLLRQLKPEIRISQTQVYRYVHGERAPRLDELVAIAEVLEVSPSFFLQAQDVPDVKGHGRRVR